MDHGISYLQTEYMHHLAPDSVHGYHASMLKNYHGIRAIGLLMTKVDTFLQTVEMGTREDIIHLVVDVNDEDSDEVMGDDIDLDLEEDAGGVTQVNKPEIDSDKRSKVWTHMTKLPPPNDEELAKCNYCSKTFSAKSKNGTSHMMRHIKKCMARRNVDIRNFCIASKVEPAGIQSMALKDQIIDFDEISKESYLHTIRRDILKLYDEERKAVEEDLKKAPGRIAFTSDNWRNDSTQDEYICITAHWVDYEWKLQKRIIRFGALTPPFDGVNIGDDVSTCLTKWNIAGKVTSFTLDNASYNNVMIVEIKRQLLRSGSDLLFDGHFFQIRCCCCHIINLLVQAGLKLIDGVVDKIRAIGKHFKHSIPKKKKFYEVAQQIYHLDAKKRLRGDCCVRWNSTYLMLDRALYFRRPIDHVIEKDKDLMQHILSNEEWDQVATIHGFLKTFYDITTEFSASKTPTSNLYFKGVWEIQCLLLEVVKGQHEYLVNMVKLMQKKFDKYWNRYNLLLSCACVLDPRYKMSFVEYCYTTLYGELYATEKTKEVLETLSTLVKDYNQVGEQSGIGNVNDLGC
ncbi:hypothetical protein KSS87_005834 [Heliosperma pusillum]|nr:hypothetical protein KSS87_005834 [Heliosperma pusillum]